MLDLHVAGMDRSTEARTFLLSVFGFASPGPLLQLDHGVEVLLLVTVWKQSLERLDLRPIAAALAWIYDRSAGNKR
jgi:hypothetical protein